MLHFVSGVGNRYCEVWFDEPVTGVQDIVIARQRNSCPQDVDAIAVHTLVIDLMRTPEEMLKAFSEGTRYEVRRAEKSDGLSVAFNFDPQIHLEAFCSFFNSFAAAKGLAPARIEQLRRYADAGHLVLSRVAQADEPLVWHAYYCAAGRARLLHSASLFRRQGGAQRNLIGRANRYLHWRDIQAFQNLGYRIYDFGGWSPPELGDVEKQRINAFKEGFGGRRVSEFNCIYATSLKGRIVLYLRRLRAKYVKGGGR